MSPESRVEMQKLQPHLPQLQGRGLAGQGRRVDMASASGSGPQCLLHSVSCRRPHLRRPQLLAALMGGLGLTFSGEGYNWREATGQDLPSQGLRASDLVCADDDQVAPRSPSPPSSALASGAVK